MLIVYMTPPGIGWHPINYMVHLAAELLEAELLILNHQKPSYFRKLEAVFLKRQIEDSNESCLLICPNPADLSSLLLIKNWRNRFSHVAAWIIDSFWLDRIPRIVKISRSFDHLFVTSKEDIPAWQQVMQVPVTWLPWGTDALRLGGKDPERIWDLTRIGRQPPEWDNDTITQQFCLERHLRFHGRLQGFDSAAQNQAMLMQLYRQTKFLLAFSNTANPTNYTHPTREYLTARWTDALACGAVVAGIPPREPSIDRLLWEGATLDLGTVRIEEGLSGIAEVMRTWKPAQAERNYQQALQRLDWRWRFLTIANSFNQTPTRLHDELRQLEQKVSVYSSPV